MGLVALVLTAGVTPLVRAVALRWGWVHRGDPKKWSVRQVAMGGGIALYVGLLPSLLTHKTLMPLIPLVTLAGFLGLWDDIKGCHPLTKLTLQTLLGVATVLGFGYIAGLPPLFSFPLTVFGVIGFMNAVNMMDNMDGTASGVVMVAALGYSLLGWMTQNPLTMTLSLTLSGVSLGFWLYNRPPALIFMGDTGSMVLGYLLSVVAFGATHGSFPDGSSRLLAPLTIAGLFICDVIFVSLWRITHKLPIWKGDTNHLSHRLYALLGSIWRANLTLYALQAGLGTFAIITVLFPSPLSFLPSSLVFLGLLGLGYRLWFVTPVPRPSPERDGGKTRW